MKARAVEGLDPTAPLRDNAAKIIGVRLAELRSFAEAALDPGASEAQHDMRIAAKRLRYALEIVSQCIGPAAEPGRRAARELQDVLGEIHDCDVMLPRVEGVESVASLLRERRELLLRRFRDLWGETSDRVWPGLESATDVPSGSPRD